MDQCMQQPVLYLITSKVFKAASRILDAESQDLRQSDRHFWLLAHAGLQPVARPRHQLAVFQGHGNFGTSRGTEQRRFTENFVGDVYFDHNSNTWLNVAGNLNAAFNDEEKILRRLTGVVDDFARMKCPDLGMGQIIENVQAFARKYWAHDVLTLGSYG
jgi:hypothetical protein